MRKGILAAAAAFAASPRGRQLFRQAKDYVRSPAGQRRIDDIRARVTRGRTPATGPRAGR
jgi:hypothetical protein